MGGSSCEAIRAKPTAAALGVRAAVGAAFASRHEFAARIATRTLRNVALNPQFNRACARLPKAARCVNREITAAGFGDAFGNNRPKRQLRVFNNVNHALFAARQNFKSGYGQDARIMVFFANEKRNFIVPWPATVNVFIHLDPNACIGNGANGAQQADAINQEMRKTLQRLKRLDALTVTKARRFRGLRLAGGAFLARLMLAGIDRARRGRRPNH